MKRLVSIGLAAAILGALYWTIDPRELLAVFAEASWAWLAWSIVMFIPTTLATAWRLTVLPPPSVSFGLGEATCLTLMASSLNLILPSKLGDIAKAVSISKRSNLPLSLATSLAVYEKACDLLALLVWCAFGLVIIGQSNPVFWVIGGFVTTGLIVGSLSLTTPLVDQTIYYVARYWAPEKIATKLRNIALSWSTMRNTNMGDPKRAAAVAGISLGIWLLHLIQIWMFIKALGGPVPFVDNLGITPLAILVGLLPLTIAGIGTRDAALIYFYQAYFGPATGAALGLLATLRYIIPAVAGLPWIRAGWALQSGASSAFKPKPPEPSDAGNSPA